MGTQTELVPFSYAGPCWFVVVTNPRCLLRAQLDLDAAGYRTFTPKTRKWVTHARVKRAVEKPILSRYLFVEVDYPRQSFGSVRTCHGVETILSNQGVPAPVPSKFVEGLLVRYLKGEWDEVASAALPLGARVRIVEGECEDMLATITQSSGNRISAKLLGTNTYKRLFTGNVRPDVPQSRKKPLVRESQISQLSKCALPPVASPDATKAMPGERNPFTIKCVSDQNFGAK